MGCVLLWSLVPYRRSDISTVIRILSVLYIRLYQMHLLVCLRGVVHAKHDESFNSLAFASKGAVGGNLESSALASVVGS